MTHRYAIETRNDRHGVAAAITEVLLARGAVPILFTRTRADAHQIAMRTGLEFLDPARPASIEDVLARFGRAEAPRGVATSFGLLSGWRAPWATDVLFLDVPTAAELLQGEARAQTAHPEQPIYVDLLHLRTESISALVPSGG